MPTWTPEQEPRWTEARAATLAGFPISFPPGALLPGSWWLVREGEEVVGYGWLDVVWGDAEILVALTPEARGRGLGGWVIDRLRDEAAARGVAYVHNVVQPQMPGAEALVGWLTKNGFRVSSDRMTWHAKVRRTAPV